MLKSNFCLNYPVTLTATEFVSPIDVPEEAEDELVTKQDWTKEQLDRHSAKLRRDIKAHHDAMINAWKEIPILFTQLRVSECRWH